MTQTTKITDAQMIALRSEYAPWGADGISFVKNKSTAEALKKKGLVDFTWSNYHKHNTYIINAAGCEAIGLDYNDVVEARLQKRAKQHMRVYVMDVSVCATEAELVEWANWTNDPQYLIDAYDACGGEIFAEETAEASTPFEPSHLLDGVPVEVTDADGEDRSVEFTNAKGDSVWMRENTWDYDERVKRIQSPASRIASHVTSLTSPDGCNCGGAFNEYGRCVCKKTVDPRDAEIEALKARVAELEERNSRLESREAKYREFVRDMCGYSFSDRDDARYVSDCVDELEGN